MIDSLAKMAWDCLLSLQGETVEVLTSKGAVWSRQAVFEENSVRVESETGFMVRTSNPSIGVFYGSNEPMIGGTDKIRARGSVFRVDKIIPDGQGGARIELHRSRESA